MKSRLRKISNRIITRVLTLLGFSSSLAFMACYGPPPTDNFLDVFPGEVDLGAVPGDSQEVTVVAQGQWEATHVPSFVSLSDSAGSDRTTIVMSSTEANDSGGVRRDSIVIESADGVATVYVNQQSAN